MGDESLRLRTDDDRRRYRHDHADARLGANPNLTIVSTSDITSDMTVAMTAGSKTLEYFGSLRGRRP